MSLSFQISISFGLFVAVLLGVGWSAAVRTKSQDEDYYLGGRSLGPHVAGLSAAATSNSGFFMLGAVGMGYTLGLSALLFPLSMMIGELTFWSLFPKRVNQIARRYRSITVPQLFAANTNQ